MRINKKSDLVKSTITIVRTSDVRGSMASLFRRKKGTSPGKAKAKSASSGARVAAPGSVKGKGLLGALRRKVSEKKMMGSSGGGGGGGSGEHRQSGSTLTKGKKK